MAQGLACQRALTKQLPVSYTGASYSHLVTAVQKLASLIVPLFISNRSFAGLVSDLVIPRKPTEQEAMLLLKGITIDG